MSRTHKVNLVPGTWKTVTESASFCVLQSQSSGPVWVAVAASPPDTGDPGLILVKTGLQEVSFFDLSAGDNVYAFTKDAGEFLVSVDNGESPP